MKASIALHIIGICLWLGTLILGSRVIVTLADSKPLPEKLLNSIKIFTIIGGAIVILSGVYQMTLGGVAAYFAQGWFHTKITLVLVLLVLSGILLYHIESIRTGRSPVKKGLLMAIHGISSLILVANVFLTVLSGSY